MLPQGCHTQQHCTLERTQGRMMQKPPVGQHACKADQIPISKPISNHT
jgi:hypothetical protein